MQVFYDFFLRRWQLDKISKEDLKKLVPKYLTQDEYENIISSQKLV